MQRHKKLKARILSLALSAAMVTTMMPATVFAAEGGTAPGANSVGEIQSFDKLEDRFHPSVGENAPDYVYGLSVALGTPEADLNLPDELTAMVARTVTTPAEDEPVVDSGKEDAPAENETISDEDEAATDDTAADDMVSGNQPASPSDAEEEVKEEIKDDDVPLALEPEDKETAVTTVEEETIPVTWQSDKEYKSGENGKFIYTAVLPEGYSLADGVKLPQIYVFVGKQARGIEPAEIIVGGSSATTGYATADYDTLNKAFTDIVNGGTVKLGADIDFQTNEINIEAKSVSLDLNDCTITGSGARLIGANENACLTVSGDDGTMVTTSDDGTILETKKNGKINVTEGSFESSSKIITNNDDGVVTISEGTLESEGWAVVNVGKNSTLILSGGNITGGDYAAVANLSTGKIRIGTEEGRGPGISNNSSTQGAILMQGGLMTSPAIILDIKAGRITNDNGYAVQFSDSSITSGNVLDYYSNTGASVGMVDPEPSDDPSVAVGAQSAAIIYGTAGTATYTVTGRNFRSPAFAPSVQWKSGASWGTAAPTGIAGTLSGSGDSRTFTVTTTATVNAGEYEFKIVSGDVESSAAKVKVDKTDYPNKTQNLSIKCDTANPAATVSLPEITGATYGVVSVTTNTDSLINGTPTVSGRTLTMDVASKADGTTAVLSIPVTTATNYKDFTMTVNIAAKNKEQVTITGLTAATGLIYNGGAQKGYVGTVVVQDNKVPVSELVYTYTSTDDGTYNSTTAPTNAGAYKLVVSVADSNETYLGTHADINFTIGKATVTITADNKSAYVGDTKPALTYTATSLASGDTLATTPTLAYETEPDMSKAGSVKIKASSAAVPNMDNYESAITYIDGTLTISNKSSGGGGGGGGSSSSITTPTKPTEPVTGSSNAPATVDSNGNATTTVTSQNISDAVKAAKDAASKKGVNAGEVTAVINVTAPANSNPNTVTVNLPKTVQEQVINGKIGNVAVVIDKPEIAISMNLATITEMHKQANADIQLSATRTDAAKLSTEAKAAIGSRPAFDLKATYASGSKSVTSFGSGSVSVTIPYTLQNGEVAGGLYAVYVDGNGKVNYLTNSSYDAEAKMLRFSTNHFSVYGIGYKAPVNFTDIANHWAKTDIEFIVNRGLMNGTSNTTFSPDGAMTRAMFVTALGRLAGIDTNSYKSGKFTDVAATAYYAPYVNWAAQKGITNGTTATTFSPDQSVSRQEMAVFMSNYAKALGYTVPETRAAVTFADNANIASWAASAVKQMQMAGILNGKNSNQFDPTGTATRGEISAMLHRYVELVIDRATSEGWTTNDSGSSLYYKSGKALVGAQTISGVAYTFNSYGEVTRKTNTAAATTQNYIVYTVKKNDWISKIALAHNCTVEEILALNGIKDKNLIYQGQQIKVPQK